LNFFPLPRNFIPHALDLGADVLKVHGQVPFCLSKRERICKLQIGLGAENWSRKCLTTNSPIACLVQ
jgi:hypothetical protein